jgi:CheY-like chemotaxis protein
LKGLKMAKILLVDDSRFQRNALKKKLCDMGHEIIEAVNGEEALVVVQSQSVACVITDLHMPTMDGFSFLKAMKGSNNPLPVIVLSADIQEETLAEIHQLGARAFLSKPVQDDLLAKTLAETLAL